MRTITNDNNFTRSISAYLSLFNESHSRNFPTEEAFYPCCIILWKKLESSSKCHQKPLIHVVLYHENKFKSRHQNVVSILWKTSLRVVIKMSSKALDPCCIVSWNQVQDSSSKCLPTHFAHCATNFGGNPKLVNHVVKQESKTSRKILSQQSLKMASLPKQLAFGRPSTWVGTWYARLVHHNLSIVFIWTSDLCRETWISFVIL